MTSNALTYVNNVGIYLCSGAFQVHSNNRNMSMKNVNGPLLLLLLLTLSGLEMCQTDGN